MLRPKNCVLAGASGTHSVCVCQIHQNPKLMLHACDFKSLLGPDQEDNLSDYKKILKMIMCDSPTDLCHLRKCSRCPGSTHLQNVLIELFEENFIESVTYKQWTSTDRSSLETISKRTDDFVDCLIEKLEKLLTHSFLAKKQSTFLNHL